MKNRIIELVKYAFWGCVTTAVNLLLFQLFVVLGMPYLLSNVVSYIIAVILSYIVNSKFVFQSADHKATNQLKFYFMRVVSITVDSLLLMLIHEVFGVALLLSKIIVSAIIISSTYLGCKLWIFKSKA